MSGNYLLDAYFVKSLSLYNDTDSDNYGNPDAATNTCLEIISVYVNNNIDCNDNLATIYPGATELCNYLDDNLTYLLSYQDADNDNFGNQFIDSLSCELPIGYVADSTDCDDTNPDIFPGAVEILNGLDDDCNGLNDDGANTFDNFLTEIKIYPNPTDGLFTIVLPEKVNIDINIRTIDGKLILLKSVIDTQIIVINLTQYAAGLYFVELQNEIDVAIIQVCKN